LSPSHAVFFLDADAMRFRLISALPQCETPGWGVKQAFNAEVLATPASDCYKLGLLALRLLAGSQVLHDPAQLPPNISPNLRSIISETLLNRDINRPSVSDWIKCLADEAAHANVINQQSFHKSNQAAVFHAPPLYHGKAVAQIIQDLSDAVYNSLTSFLSHEPILRILGSSLLICLLVVVSMQRKPGFHRIEGPASVSDDQSRISPSNNSYTPLYSNKFSYADGIWKGYYTCDGQKRAVELTIVSAPGDGEQSAVRALFRFSKSPDNPSDSIQSGSFLMIGSHSLPSDDMQSKAELVLNADSWIEQPTGYRMLNLRGRVNPVSMQISGEIESDNCSSFFLSYHGPIAANSFDGIVESASTKGLIFQNNCHYSVRLVLRYLDARSNQWRTDGWWEVRDNYKTTLSVDDIKLLIKSPSVHFYAEITQSPYLNQSWSGDNNISFGGRSLRLRHDRLPVDTSGQYVLSIDCANLR
jgi:hypothetical protein